jgi:hypothetical protein
VSDELALLDELEADLTAVEEAMATLDRITADGVGGAAAATEIAAVVSADRFPDGTLVTEVDLTEAPAAPAPTAAPAPGDDRTGGWPDQTWSAGD